MHDNLQPIALHNLQRKIPPHLAPAPGESTVSLIRITIPAPAADPARKARKRRRTVQSSYNPSGPNRCGSGGAASQRPPAPRHSGHKAGITAGASRASRMGNHGWASRMASRIGHHGRGVTGVTGGESRIASRMSHAHGRHRRTSRVRCHSRHRRNGRLVTAVV